MHVKYKPADLNEKERGGRESREILNSQPETPLLSPILVTTLVLVLTLIWRQHSLSIACVMACSVLWVLPPKFCTIQGTASDLVAYSLYFKWHINIQQGHISSTEQKHLG